jgi:hypothetical protein
VLGSATSNEATLTVNAPPGITQQPTNQSVTEGQPATFTVAATGSATLTYQWQRNQANITSATSSTYMLGSATSADNGAKFRCVVTNGFGNATSNEATLTVLPPAPVLMSEGNTDSAIAVDSVNMMRDPFPLLNLLNFSNDDRTRIKFFAMNLPANNPASVTVRAEDATMNVYPLTVEYIGKLAEAPSLTEIVVRLPDNLPVMTTLQVSVTFNSQTSNKVRIRMQ